MEETEMNGVQHTLTHRWEVTQMETMSMSEIIQMAVAALGTLGGWEAVKYLLNRRVNNRKAEAEAADRQGAGRCRLHHAENPVTKVYYSLSPLQGTFAREGLFRTLL